MIGLKRTSHNRCKIVDKYGGYHGVFPSRKDADNFRFVSGNNPDWRIVEI